MSRYCALRSCHTSVARCVFLSCIAAHASAVSKVSRRWRESVSSPSRVKNCWCFFLAEVPETKTTPSSSFCAHSGTKRLGAKVSSSSRSRAFIDRRVRLRACMRVCVCVCVCACVCARVRVFCVLYDDEFQKETHCFVVGTDVGTWGAQNFASNELVYTTLQTPKTYPSQTSVGVSH